MESAERSWPRTVAREAFAGMLFGLVMLASGTGRGDEAMPTHIAPEALLARIEAGDPPTIVDVRSQSEYDSGHVPGAIHIPFWAAYARASRIPAGPEDEIVVYCAHGPRAGLAKAGLRLAGFHHIVYLEGHMTGWKSAGLPQESDSAPLP